MLTPQLPAFPLAGEEIQSVNLEHIVDAGADEPDPRTVAAKERAKAMKKRAKKIKAKMAAKTADFERKQNALGKKKINRQLGRLIPCSFLLITSWNQMRKPVWKTSYINPPLKAY